MVEDLETPQGEAMFRLFNLVLGPDAQFDGATVLDGIGSDRDRDEFGEACETLLLTKVERDCTINTKEWLNQV